MEPNDSEAVQRTEPEEAAAEGYPIADDGEHARRITTLAQDALAAGAPEMDESELYALAERFVAEQPAGTVELFLDWLRATRSTA